MWGKKDIVHFDFLTHNILLLTKFGLAWFYGILTIVGYFKPNPVDTYLLNIHDL